MSKSGPSNQDNSYGKTTAQLDISPDELQDLCKELEYVRRLEVTESQQEGIALRTT